MSSAPRTPVKGASLRPHPFSPTKSVFVPSSYTRGTAQTRFKSNAAALFILLALWCFAPSVVEFALGTVRLVASAFGDHFAAKVVSFVEIAIPLLFFWNAAEAAYLIKWPATYPTSPPTPGPFSTPLSPAQRRLRGLTPKPARPPSFPPAALPPSPLRSPTHPPLDQSTSHSYFQGSPTKSISDKNPFLSSTAPSLPPLTPMRSLSASSTNPFLNSSYGGRGPPPLRDQPSMFIDSSPVAAFNGKHSVGPGRALDSSMVQSFVSELDR